MITEKFYPITTSELTRLSSLLTDGELKIYLYLMAANPFGDRFHKLDTSVLAENLGVTRRMIQKTLRKLESLELIELEIASFQYRKKVSPAEADEHTFAKRTRDRQGEHRIAKANTGSPRRTQDRQGELEPLPNNEPETLQTIKTLQTLQTVSRAEDCNFQTEPPSITNDTNVSIPQNLLDRLTELEIPIDSKITTAIELHDISQSWSAIRHIEETAATIKSKYAVFLHQLPKQPSQKPIKGLSAEFNEWYGYARGEIVEDTPAEYLPLDRYGEPLVRLLSRPNELIEWRRAKGGEGFDRVSPEELRSTLDKSPQLKKMLGRIDHGLDS